ncbi:methyl-accepting chemotaxis protein [Neoaquamicrobium sediminum]|uniref:methyl-accepting chemotaxis protein n=1 Tax=Neoaquamicrobium sediminum TaxID=1849104 RepID=UPI003BAAFA6A
MNAFRISTRLYALVGLTLVIMVSAMGFALLQEQGKLVDERKAMLAAMNENAVHIFQAYQEKEASGALTREEAQSLAMEAIRPMRYQADGYFFITDMNENMLMHPVRPDMDGTNQSGMEDPTGKRIFVEFGNTVEAEGKGFVDYLWPKPGLEEPVLKLSHVQGFAPWGWIVGTGVYADDLDAMFYDNAMILGSVMLIGILLTLVAAYAVVRSVVHPVNALTSVMGRLASGDNSVEIPAINRKDEIGDMAKAVLVFKEAAIEKIRLEGETEHARGAAEAERSRNESEKARKAEEDHVAISALATGLSALANGDLTYRITDTFSPEAQRLKDDFNATAQQLQDTMVTITGAIEGMRSGTGEISQAADDLSRRTEQQAASLEETAAALDEITATVKKTAEGAHQASQVTDQARVGAEKSGAVVREAVEAMAQIEKSSQQIGQIIGVIDEIAFQTNLLALNAGVEAARAGDAGKGFAVVASEVRALAQRSAEAAKEIKDLISTSTQQVDQGVDLVGQTGSALEKIVAQVGEITGLVTEIAASAREQSTGLGEVNTAVNQMDQVTQQNAAMVEQSTAASHHLAQEADELARLVSKFRLGSQAGAQTAPRKVAVAANNSAPVAAVTPKPQSARPALKAVSAGGGHAAALLAGQPQDDGWEEF